MNNGMAWAGFWSRLIFSAGWCIAVAGAFLITWIAPYSFGPTAVHKMTFVMLIEFLVVHSTGFFTAISAMESPAPWWKTKAVDHARAGARKRALMFAGLLAFYLLMAASFAAMYGGPWPIYAFLAVALPKLPAILFHPRDDDAMFWGMANWAAMTVLFLGGAFATLIYDVPHLGVSEEVIARQGFTTGGIWPEEPYRVLAFGAIYFTGQAALSAVGELGSFRRLWRGIGD